MKIFLTSNKETLYKEYYDRTVQLSAKHGLDTTPMEYKDFNKAFSKMTIATREQRWSAEAIMNKLVKGTVSPTSHRQAMAAIKANPELSYDQVRYHPEFWDMVQQEYMSMTKKMSGKEAHKKIGQRFFDSK